MMRLIQILGNRKAGFLIGMACILNLIIGSTVMNFYPEIYPPFFNFDINFFFEPVRPLHGWFYLLMISFAVLGGSVFFSTLESITGLVKPGRTGADGKSRLFLKRTRSLAGIFAHLAFIIALFAHLIDGLYGGIKRVQVTAGKTQGAEEWSDIPGIGKMKIDSVKDISYPDRSRKDLVINSTFLLNNNQMMTREISYNSPALFDNSSREVLIQDGRNFPVAVFMRDDMNREYYLPLNKPVEVRGGIIRFMGVEEMSRGMAAAQFMTRGSGGDKKFKRQFIVMNSASVRYSSINLGDAVYRIHKTEERFMLFAMVVYNPSIIIISISVFLVLVGLYFMYKGTSAD